MIQGEMIRHENTSDTAAIRNVLLSAFPTAAEADLVERLREAGRPGVSLVAEFDGRIVGHIAFSPVTVEVQPPQIRGIGIAPLSVDPEFQRQGIGSALVREGIADCRQRGESFVVVLGDPDYYSRFGFETASRFGLANEYGVDEPFMVMELQPGAISSCRGMVRYCSEFSGLE